MLAPTALAHAHARIDIDIDVEADLNVVARVESRVRDGLTFAWDWGDGVVSAGLEARHAYERAGRYEVVLTVEDPDTGECWRLERVIKVEAKAERRDREDTKASDDKEEKKEEPRERGRSRTSASANANVGRGGISVGAGLDLGRERSDAGNDADTRSSSNARVRSYGSASDRHTVPDAGLAAVIPALGALAFALRRR